MSDSQAPNLKLHSSPSSLALLDHHNPHPHHHLHHHPPHHHHAPPPPPSPAATTTHNHNPSSPSSSSSLAREYRKGNWTLQETLVLINAKRLDDERRTNRASSSLDTKPNILQGGGPPAPSQQHCRSAELRWKWVENYCWRNGCLRSQNQCNDKWDNLLRDYKKVRDYEARCVNDRGGLVDVSSAAPSYWAMEKHERKERNLPSNLALEVFQALTDVLSRRNAHKSGGGSSTAVNASTAIPAQPISSSPHSVPPLPPPQPPPPNHQQTPTPSSAALPPPAPPPPPLPLLPPPPHRQQQQQQQPQSSSVPETSGTSESAADEDEDEDDDRRVEESDPKRRRKGRDIGSSVVRGASVLARTLLACEEKREKRHRDLLELEERRLRVEEDRTEMSRQGFAGLIAAVNNLSGAIHALVSDHHHNRHRRSSDEGRDLMQRS